VAANNATSTLASANLFINGSALGDCGSSFDLTAALSDTIGNSYPITIDKTKFFSVTGMSVSQPILRSAQTYTLTVDVAATAA